MNQIEIAFQEALSESQISVKNCKECPYFSLAQNEPRCDFAGAQLEDCRIAVRELNLAP